MPSMLDPITQRHLERAADALVGEFTGVFGRETIERYITESLDLLGAPRFSDFLPVLAHRFARQRLRALGQADGTIVEELPEVLFVCVQNAGRSQMAAGLLRLRSEDRIHVRRRARRLPTRSTRSSCRRWPRSGSTWGRRSRSH